MKNKITIVLLLLSFVVVAQEQKKPNILIIWGDDIGMWNVSAYHRGMMGGSTPTLIALPMKV